MEIRDAILLTADLIETTPSEFDFFSIEIPEGPGCGTPGCAVGWICCFQGIHEDSEFDRGVGGDACSFYQRMAEIDGHDWEASGNWGPWTKDAAHCARNLRIYADRHHPETTAVG